MKQIIANQNLVFPAKDVGIEVDTSALAELGIVHYEHDGREEWVEREPFEGREEVPGEARAIIDGLLAEAQAILDAPEPEPDPDEVPASVTRRQARQQLLIEGYFDQVQPAIDAIPDEMERRLMQIYWDDAQDFERTSLELIGLGYSLGLTDDDIDELFRRAAKR